MFVNQIYNFSYVFELIIVAFVIVVGGISESVKSEVKSFVRILKFFDFAYVFFKLLEDCLNYLNFFQIAIISNMIKLNMCKLVIEQ